MTFNDVEFAKIYDKIYECFEKNILKTFETNGYLAELAEMELDDEDLYCEISDTIYAWHQDIYDECARNVCYSNAAHIIRLFSEDKMVYDDIVETIVENEYDVPNNEKEFAYKLIDYGFIFTEGRHESWFEYAITDVAYKIIEMVR